MDKKDMTTLTTQMQIAEWVTKGKSRKFIMDKLMNEEGLTRANANTLYYGALKEITPEPDLMDNYKRVLIQQNLDRLEQIVNTSIDGNYQDKAVALKAIDQLNRLCGAYADTNSVTVARNKDGEEIIQITFDR